MAAMSPPIPFKELNRRLKARAPITEKPIAVERRFHLAADKEPVVKTRVQRIDRGDGLTHWEVIVDVNGVRAGGRALAPPLKGEPTKVEKRRVSEEQLTQRLSGFMPDHLGFNAVPLELVKSVKNAFGRRKAAGGSPRRSPWRRQPSRLSGHNLSLVHHRTG